MAGVSDVLDYAKKAAEAFTYLQTRSEKADLAEARRQNDNCLHLLILGGFLSSKPQDGNAAEKEIKENSGVYFTLAFTSRTFYHPDTAFTPNGYVGWLVRSEWRQDGLYQKHAEGNPVVQAIDRKGFWWRQISNDKGGGDQREGFCRLCAKAKKELEGT